ncbi:MAG: undecaprenyl-diphosphate phosphatase [Candidatus Binataceae bacterium]
MFSTLQAIILGAVQGLTEFLPVSSSAHLVLIPWFFGWQDPGLAFDVALHLGTLVALLVYYWRDWTEMAASIFNGDAARRRLLVLLIVASIPGALIGLALEKPAETLFREHILWIGLALGVLGIALWFIDEYRPNKRTIGQLSFLDAIAIGLSQALAIFPGVSRSGATITMARLLGVERQDAANFSFLMATPIIAGAGLLESRKILHAGLTAQVGWGFITATIFGIIAIVGLIRFVKTRTYVPFAWYRVALAVVVIAVVIARA